jgi:hypothetical protein
MELRDYKRSKIEHCICSVKYSLHPQNATLVS